VVSRPKTVRFEVSAGVGGHPSPCPWARPDHIYPKRSQLAIVLYLDVSIRSRSRHS
jgi:hypothetical protein